jgi:hypothetical protein
MIILAATELLKVILGGVYGIRFIGFEKSDNRGD